MQSFPDYIIGGAKCPERDAAMQEWIDANHQKKAYRDPHMPQFTLQFKQDCLKAVNMPDTIHNRILVTILSLDHLKRKARFYPQYSGLRP